MTVQPKAGELARYQLEDRYTQEKGRVFMTGTQALVRAVLDQARRDRASGLNTAGFISGYRGSPLGALDLELWKAKDRLDAARIEFLPAVNEDLAATAVLGSQQVETNPKREVEGVFGLWYGKGPGVDRSGDALKHGNAYGSSPHGGVLVVAGDDHGCVSSSMPHQSDVAFMSWFMPTLNPASVSEYLAFAEYGYALSRFSGMWVGFKAISETVESAASVDIPAPRAFETPDFTPPPGGLHYRWPDLPGPQIEERMEAKKHAVLAFAEANPVDRHIYDVKDARFGIVTTGKAHLDLMEALRLLGIGEAACRKLGIDIYKVGMVWPLARRAALDFVKDKQEVLVIEEKRGIVESQFKEYFYDWPGHKPHAMVGKRDEDGERLVPWTGELSPRLLLPVVARRLEGIFPGSGFIARAEKILAAPAIALQVEGATRTPYFCSGCPHNTSTKVPEGSEALAGIGCHFMASWMDRNTTSLIQMGGEGVNWAASSLFTGKNHVFQNLGEGTWYHSGSMAVRQAIAAKANITFKILYNDAVAMTGGQPVDGPVSVQAIAHASRAEGVERIALVSDHPDKFQPGELPVATTIHHRRELDAVQRELREVKGVSILIYEQTCATEKRRRRKRGQMEDPKKFVVINDLVCEGCGDCSVESNCLSVEPLETEFGTKRKINQSSCNKDFSCVNGFCPSFVTVEGATRKKRSGMEFDLTRLAGDLPDPEPAALDRPFDLMITGVGGTGVVTVGALITMAAHLEGKGSSVLDFTGFAQKFGPVLSYVRLASAPDAIHQVRIDRGAADALIGCDIVVSSSPKASASYRPGMHAVVNLAEMPTGDIVRKRDASLHVDQRLAAIEGVTGKDALAAMDANRLSEKLMGDTVFANVMMLGFAWQKGLVPVSLNALTQAIVLNGVAIEKNHRAFLIGRLAAEKPDALKGLLDPKSQADGTLDEIVTRREAFLTDYQNAAYAERYRHLVDRVRAAEAPFGSDAISRAVARSLFKLMAYKDEYEVARLHTQTGFSARIAEEFEGDYRIVHHLAPPFLASGTDARGRPLKREFGPWVRLPFRMLARMKRLRGTAFDPFGRTAERRMERELIGWYEAHVEKALAQLDTGNAATLAETLALPMQIRGYGPVKEEAAKRIRTEMAARL
ncbi:indolepyruvate ferredoxin oxidoreductase family protein [Nitratireductor aquimarinus]|uniref:indolepyruvate ferredoxin oxidoreductase family protein n=1 Tax=Alphaproteobacteria TaxID=28211 RepID=UPI0019D388B5|nr:MULTISPECIES: indolepyruvate ferredoxin oxidoreductase family protein [Alphaproteobacteria]MBN7755380.1 indolepyruvate ferredoxin oxidoreductase family protein [Nitratireductor aquimarinus]MBY5998135.1 indolepyruvate ferredoxin oxidoreductase family protein [Tritonibacter mobilis]MBY6020162.1 indolepyruvate ferredoxin oxidoreductase family protein [Nitratireductor sp. DP7N14-4]